MSKKDGINVACVACDACKLAFPPDLIGPLIMENNTLQVCPICALRIIRREHKLPRFVFRKHENQLLYNRAVEHNIARKVEYNGETLA